VASSSGEDIMHAYRAYIIGDDGHVKKRFDLPCENDEDAVERAKQLVDGHAVELWDMGRKIATFPRRPA